MKVRASAPSNIALIKYMGKVESALNRPANASLSYTLDHLRSFVEIEEAPRESWEPLPDLPELRLSEKGRAKFLAHFARLKTEWRIEGLFTVRSANNFPSDCGLASSASSFAALTLAAYELARAQNAGFHLPLAELSRQSRRGSGSSCRSFHSPWALWRTDGAEPAPLSLRLHHAVVLVEETEKAVSSSEAHARVTGSLLYEGRVRRAELRLEELMAALREGDWRGAHELCWSEFWDMHALFETSRPSFGYMTQGSIRVLEHMRKIWNSGDGPLVTMDAGPNVHLLLREDQLERASREWLHCFACLTSWEGR